MTIPYLPECVEECIGDLDTQHELGAVTDG